MKNQITSDASASFAAPVDMAEAEKMKTDFGRDILEIGRKIRTVKEKKNCHEINPAAAEAQRQTLLKHLLIAHQGLTAVKAYILEHDQSDQSMSLPISPELQKAYGGSLAGHKFVAPTSAAQAVARHSQLVLEIKGIETQLSALKARFPSGEMPAENFHWRSRAIHAKGLKEAEVGALGVWIRDRRRSIEVASLGENLDISNPCHLIKGLLVIIKKHGQWQQFTKTDQAFLNTAQKYLEDF